MPDKRTRHEIIDDLNVYLDNAGGLANPAVVELMAAYRELSAAVRAAAAVPKTEDADEWIELRYAVNVAAELLATEAKS